MGLVFASSCCGNRCRTMAAENEKRHASKYTKRIDFMVPASSHSLSILILAKGRNDTAYSACSAVNVENNVRGFRIMLMTY